MMLEVREISVRYGNLTVVDRASFTLNDGRWLMIVGPNGAGKSTLLNAVARMIPHEGSVFVDGEDLAKVRPRAVARKLGLLSQSHSVGYAFTVEQVVRLGRYAYRGGPFSEPGADNEAQIDKALHATGMEAFRDHSVLTLSGGELQRTFLAQLLAQDPKLLLLDEPTNHLDLAYQKEVFRLIGEWVRDTGRSVISVVHDLSLARAYGDEALLMNQGQIIARGDAKTALSDENLAAAYGMDVRGWMRGLYAQWT
jgi:iron complex transport system ATP-binding protein